MTGPGATHDDPILVPTDSAESTREAARRIARHLRAGDLLVLDGPLGAGKTTFTQGLGEELGVRGPIASPTFVISRVHPSLVGGPALVHVDAYRLGGVFDVEDLDLDAELDQAVTVAEWGHGRIEHLADSHLLIRLHRAAELPGTPVADADPEEPESLDEPRSLTVHPSGPRWGAAEIAALRTELTGTGAPTPVTPASSPTDGVS